MMKMKIKDKYEFIENVYDLIPHIREHMGDEVSEFVRECIVDLEDEIEWLSEHNDNLLEELIEYE